MLKIKQQYENKIVTINKRGRFVKLDTSQFLTQEELKFYKKIGFDIFDEVCDECEKNPCKCKKESESKDEDPKPKNKKYKGIDENDSKEKEEDK
jgi:hypothetical protein